MPSATRSMMQTPCVRTRSIDGGVEESEVFRGAMAAARLHGLPHEVFTATAVNARFRVHQIP